MKKILWTGLCVGLIAALFMPYRQREQFLIKAKYQNIYNVLLKPGNWPKWQPELNAAQRMHPEKVTLLKAGNDLTIYSPKTKINVKVNGFGFNVEKQLKYIRWAYSFTILPDSNIRNTQVQLDIATSLFKQITGLLSHYSTPQHDIFGLKNFMENDSAYYGFKIVKGQTVNPVIMVKKARVIADKKYTIMREMLQLLKQTIAKYHLQAAAPVMSTITSLSADYIQVMIGVPVNRQTNATGVTFMQMPKQSKTIFIHFKGRYNQREAAYEALKKYVADHGQNMPALPYEIYLNNRLPASDTTMADVQIIYPVQ